MFSIFMDPTYITDTFSYYWEYLKQSFIYRYHMLSRVMSEDFFVIDDDAQLMSDESIQNLLTEKTIEEHPPINDENVF